MKWLQCNSVDYFWKNPIVHRMHFASQARGKKVANGVTQTNDSHTVNEGQNSRLKQWSVFH